MVSAELDHVEMLGNLSQDKRCIIIYLKFVTEMAAAVVK